MPLLVRAFPVCRPVEEVRSFAAQLGGERRADTAEFYREYGVAHESWHLQETPSGPWIIGVTILDDPAEAAPRYAGASQEFHAWFKSQVLHLTGCDPSVEPLGPPTSEIFAWSDADRPAVVAGA